MININLKKIAIVVISILVIPLLGNMFWSGWNWQISDFFLMGGILYFIGILINLAYAKLHSTPLRIIAYGIIILPFLFLWALIVSDGELIPRIFSWYNSI